MAFSKRACRYGGIMSGQAIMSHADAAMSFAVAAAMKKFLPIGTVDQTTHFLTSI
jgi:acyl-coenzyme A thioesterase PaaI-like protein